MSTNIIFRSGLTTIGGTIVEIINNNDRIIFDFGTVFNANGNDEAVPNVKGVYDNSSDYNDHVFMSHLHLDHSKAMNLVHEDIKLYTHEDTVKLIDTLYEIDFQGFKGEKRDYTPLKHLDKVIINEMSVTLLEVDHDVSGASAFLIETPDVTLFYSGDIRIHGRHSQKTFKTLEYVKTFNVDIAIFEGVTISFIEDDYEINPSKDILFEQDENNFVKNIVEKCDTNNMLFVNPYIMSSDRLVSIIELAKECNKTICLDNRFGHIFKKYYSNIDFKILEKDELNIGAEIISYNDIDENCLVLFDFNNRDKYVNAVNKVKTTLIQTGGEPLGDYDPRWTQLVEFCENNNIELLPFGPGGHASPENLLYLVEEVKPKTLIPLHSFKPELLKSNHPEIEQLLVEVDKVYTYTKNNN